MLFSYEKCLSIISTRGTEKKPEITVPLVLSLHVMHILYKEHARQYL